MAQSLFNTGVKEKISQTIKSVNSPTGGPFTTLASSAQSDFMNLGNYAGDFMDLSEPTKKPPTLENLREQFLTNKAQVPYPPEERERGSLQEALGRGVWSALDSATFHASRLFVTEGGESLADKMMGKSETRLGKYGEAIGEAAGFLPAFGLVGKAASYGVKGFTQFGSKKVAKELSEKVAQAAGLKSEINWISKSGETFTKAEIKGMTGKAASEQFVKSMEKQWIKPVENFSHAFRNTAQKNVFQKSVKKNFGEKLREQFALDNISIGDDAVNIIEKSFRSAFKDGRRLPVSTISDLISRRIGIDSKLGAAAALLMEEAILFSGVETIFETFNAAAEERPSHYFDTVKHAMGMGAILGAVRLIPGGKLYGNTLLAGKEGGLTQFNRLIMSRQPFKGRIDPTKASDREGMARLWEYFAKNDLKDGAGAPLKDILTRSAGNHKHTLDRVFGGNHGKNYVGIRTFDIPSIRKVLEQPGTGWRTIKGKKINQKDAIGEVMAEGLDDVYRVFRSRWAGEFFKDYAKDFVRSSPRMFIGGIAMSGGPGIAFDDNIDMTDKLFHLSLGAFMMKRGKELKWHTKSGREVVNEGGFFGKPKPWTYSKTFNEITTQMKMLGGEPGYHADWAELRQNSEKSLLMWMDSINKNAKTTEGTDNLRDEFFRQEGGKDIYFTDKEQGNTLPKKDSVELHETKQLYEVFKEYNGNRNLSERPGDKPLYVKEWDNLTLKQKRAFKESMDAKGIKHENDIIDIIAESNIDTIHSVQERVGGDLITALKHLRAEDDGMLWQTPAEGRMKFPAIRPAKDKNNKFDETELEAVYMYNKFVDMLVDKGSAEIYMKDASEIGMDIGKDTKGAMEFINTIKETYERFNQGLGLDLNKSKAIDPSDPMFVSFNSFASMFGNINRSRDFLVKALYNDPSGQSNFESEKLERADALIKQIYFSKNNIVHDQVEVVGGNYTQQRFIDGLHEIIKFHGVSRTQIGKQIASSNIHKVTNKDVINELRDVLVSEGITLFDHQNTQVRNEFLYNLKRKTIKDKLKGKVWDKDGTLRDVTEGDVEAVSQLIDVGIVNENLTAHKIPQIWGDVTKAENLAVTESFIKAFGEGKLSKDQIAQFSKDMEVSKEGESAAFLNSYLETKALELKNDSSIGINTIAGARKHIANEFNHAMTAWKEVFEPYLIKTVNGQTGGILHLNKTQPVAMDRLQLVSLTAQLNFVKTKKINHDTEKWINTLEEASKNKDHEYYGFSNMLLRELSGSSENAVRFLELANRHKIYDSSKKKLLIDTKTGSPKEKIEMFLESLSRRNGYGSVEQLKDYYSKYKEFVQEQGEPNKFHTVNFSNISKDYNITNVPLIDRDGAAHAVNDRSDVAVDKQMADIYEHFASGKTKPERQAGKDLFHKELIRIIKQNSKDSGQPIIGEARKRLHNVTDKLLHDMENSIMIPNIQVGLNKRIANIVDMQHRLKGTYVIEAMNDITGVMRVGEIEGQPLVQFVDKEVKGEKKGFVPLAANATKVNQLLYNGDTIMLEQRMKIAESQGHDFAGDPPIIGPEKQVLYMYGGEHGFAISMGTHERATIANNYSSYLKGLGFGKAQIKEYLNEAGIKLSKEGLEYKRDTADDMMQSIKRIMDDRIYSDIFGKDMWFNEMRDYKGAEFAPMVKRTSLFNNYDSSTYRKSDILAIAKRRADAGLHSKEEVQTLRKFANGKYKMVTIRDEQKEGFMDLKEKMLADLRDQKSMYPEGSEQSKRVDREMDYIKRSFEKDSMVNGFSVVEDKLFDAWASLGGAVQSDGIGAIKPVMLRKGNQFFVTKTAFQKDASLAQLWKDNPGLGMVTFTSSNKTVTKDNSYHPWMESKVVDYEGSWAELRPEHYTGKEVTIRPEDVQILSQKGINNKATLAPNHTVGMAKDAQAQYFENHIRPEYDKSRHAFAEWSDPNQYMKAIGLNKARNHDMYADAIQTGTHMGVGQRMAKFNINPQISPFNSEFNNYLKKKHIDSLLSLKVNGSQATLSPDMHGELKGTILGRDSRAEAGQYSRGRTVVIGESKLPHHTRSQSFIPEQTSLVPKIFKGEDPSFEGGTGFKTEQGSEYVVEGKTSRRFKVPKTGKGPGPKRKSTRTYFMTEAAAKKMFGKFMGVSPSRWMQAKTRTFGLMGISLDGKVYSASLTPKVGLTPVEIMMKGDKISPLGTGVVESYHVGHKIIETGIKIGDKGGKPAHIEDSTKTMKLVSEVAKDNKDFEGLSELGALHDMAEKHGWDVLVAVERNPHTKPDSAILQRLRGFKAESEGANATVNAADLKRALEGDHDLDTGNFYWDMGGKVRDAYFKQRGTVSDSNPSGDLKAGNGRSSWADVDFHNAKDYHALLAKQQSAKIQRGTIMATQKTLEAVMNYKGTHTIRSGKLKGSNLIKIGEGTALRVKQESRNEITQRLADDIQGILDSKGEFDLAYFKEWESDFWFGNDGVYELVGLNPSTKKWVASSGESIPTWASNMVMQSIINPYKRLNRLSTGTWSTGKRQNVTFDEFRAGVSKFNSDLWNAEANALAAAVRGGLKKNSSTYQYLKKGGIFNDMNLNMQILNKLTDGQQKLLTPYDRTMKMMYNLTSIARVKPPLSSQTHEYQWEKDIFSLEASTTIENPTIHDLWSVYRKEIKSHAEKSDFINHMDDRIKTMSSLQRKFSENAGMSESFGETKAVYEKYRNQAIQTLTFKINSKGKAFNKVWKKGYKNYKTGQWTAGKAVWETGKGKQATNEQTRLWKAILKEKKAALFKEAIKGKNNHEERKAAIEQFNKDNKNDRLVLDKLKDEGIQFDTMDYNEQVSAVAMMDAFGSIANIEMLNNVGGKTQLKYEHKTADSYANDLSKFVSKAWKDFYAEGNNRYENENRVQEEIAHKMTEYYTHLYNQNPAMANLFLYKFMTPRVSPGKLMRMGNKWFMSPENPKSFGTNVKAGLRFVNDSKGLFSETEKDVFFGNVTTALNRAYLKIHGVNTGDAFGGGTMKLDTKGNLVYGGRDIHGEFRDVIDNTNIWYESNNPLQYTGSGELGKLLENLNPALMSKIGEGASTITQYETMRKLFGTGSIKNISDSFNLGFVPRGTMSDYSKHGYHYAINGMDSYMKALDKGHYGLMGDYQMHDGLLGNGSMESIHPIAEVRRKETATQRVERRKTNCKK